MKHKCQCHIPKSVNESTNKLKKIFPKKIIQGSSSKFDDIDLNDGYKTPYIEGLSIIDQLMQESGLMEADVPASAGWNGPLTTVNTALGRKFHTPKEIKKHENTTGKLSPLTLLSTPEKDTDDNGKDVPQVVSRGVRSIATTTDFPNSMSQW